MRHKGLLFLLLTSLVISGCAVSKSTTSENSSTSSQSETEQRIREIYQAYVKNVTDAGGTPLSYEEWLASIKGEKGDPGIPGKDGTSLITGNGVPNNSIGKDGDSYIDSLTWDFYVKNNGVWQIVGNISPLSEVYIVSFDTAGGSAVSSQRVQYAGKINEPNEPYKDGYIFYEWLLNGRHFEYAKAYQSNNVLNWDLYAVTSDVTFTANYISKSGSSSAEPISSSSEPISSTSTPISSSETPEPISSTSAPISSSEKPEPISSSVTPEPISSTTLPPVPYSSSVTPEPSSSSLTPTPSSSSIIPTPVEEETINYTFTDKDWSALPESWTSTGEGLKYDGDKMGVQINANPGAGGCVSPRSYNNISKIDVTYFCNRGNVTKGTISISVDGKTTTKDVDNSYNDQNVGHMIFNYPSYVSGEVTLEVEVSYKSVYIRSIAITYTNGPIVPIYPTSISVPNSLDMMVGRTTSLDVTFTPSNCNQKNVTLSSDNTSVVTIESGKLKALSVGTANVTVKAKSESGADLSATCKVTVTQAINDDYTILVYMCGSTLEYDSSEDDGVYCATADIAEMLTNSCPTGVNVVVETGGAQKWSSQFGIKADKIGRWHIEGKTLVNDVQLSNADMSKKATLQSFVEYGINEYPADKMALLMWDHGNGISGTCFDDNYNYGYEGLTAGEVSTAMEDAFIATGFNNKFEWIGYDACLMSYLDSASLNADYFNYMLASQELENGEGWDYNKSFKRIYDNPKADSKTLLSNIAKDYVDYYSTSTSYEYNDQTMSLLDLSKMPTLTTAFESYAANFDSDDLSNIYEAYACCDLLYGYGVQYDYFEDTYYLVYDSGLGDLAEFLSYMEIVFPEYSTSAILEALDDVVIISCYGDYYEEEFDYRPCGLSVFVAYGFGFELEVDSQGNITDMGELEEFYIYPYKDEYSENDTKLSTWRLLMMESDFWYED